MIGLRILPVVEGIEANNLVMLQNLRTLIHFERPVAHHGNAARAGLHKGFA